MEAQLQLLKHSIDAHYDGAYWMDTDNRFVYVNDTGCKALGYQREELLGRTIDNVNPKATAEAMKRVWERLRSDGYFSTEAVHRRKDGSEFPVEIVATYVYSGGREYNCGFARDITERKRAEEAIRSQLDELRRWHEVTVGRENRVQELKREVNALCRRLGEPVRYPSQEEDAADSWKMGA